MKHKSDEVISQEERKRILEEQILTHQAGGKRLESQMGFQAVLVTENRPNHLIHLILTILTGGLWALIWIFVVLSKKDRREILQVDEYGMTRLIPAKS